jgi:hypothetical protein
MVNWGRICQHREGPTPKSQQQQQQQQKRVMGKLKVHLIFKNKWINKKQNLYQ